MKEEKEEEVRGRGTESAGEYRRENQNSDVRCVNERANRREKVERERERERAWRVCVWTRGLLSKVSKAPVGAFEGGRRSPR